MAMEDCKLLTEIKEIIFYRLFGYGYQKLTDKSLEYLSACFRAKVFKKINNLSLDFTG